MPTTKHIVSNYIAIVCLAVCYTCIAFFIPRYQTLWLLSSYSLAFIATYWLLQKANYSFKYVLILGIAFRCIFLGAIPSLSQDFYRFIWDGRLLFNGVNPYLFTPNTLMEQGIANMPQAQFLYTQMGSLSAANFSNYPPINQLFFYIAACIGYKSIVASVLVFKCIHIAADIGIAIVGIKLLQLLQLPVKNIYWYFLNPLVIIELTGNAHFEGVMLFFLAVAFWYVHKQQYNWAALFFACSIAVKLIPLLLLPILCRYIPFKKLSSLYLQIGIWLLIFLLPFASPTFIQNYAATISLWFVQFEFNASIYYVVRYIGFQLKGYNIIQTAGKILPIISMVTIVVLSFLKQNKHPKNLHQSLLIALTIYFLLATTVHPWYIINLVFLCVFTTYTYAYWFSGLVFISYAAYATNTTNENSFILWIEYGITIFLLLSQTLFKKQNPIA